MTTSPLDDLFGAEAGGDFISIPLTDQRFEITKAEAGPSKAGDPQFKMTLTARGGPADGQLLIHRMTFKADGSAGGWSIVNRSLAAMGITPEFAQQVAANVPVGSQVLTLFIEAAKVVVGRTVLADIAAQGGDGAYAARMQVQYNLKADTNAPTAAPAAVEAPAVNVAPAAVAVDVPPAAPVAEGDAPPF